MLFLCVKNQGFKLTFSLCMRLINTQNLVTLFYIIHILCPDFENCKSDSLQTLLDIIYLCDFYHWELSGL